MNTKLKIYSIFIAAFISVSTAWGMVDAAKAAGDSAYIQGDYKQAIQIYEQILTQGEAADIYYNLGNSYYKDNQLAKAILNYERALLLQPNNADIQANLEIANAKTVDKVQSIPDVFFIAWGKTIVQSQSADTWGKWGIALFLLSLISWAIFLFIKQVSWKKVGFYTGVVTLILVIICQIFAMEQKKALLQRDQAIVLSPSITVRSTPSESGTKLFILHEGHKIRIKDDTMADWKEICLEDGKVGWIPASSIEII